MPKLFWNALKLSPLLLGAILLLGNRTQAAEVFVAESLNGGNLRSELSQRVAPEAKLSNLSQPRQKTPVPDAFAQ